MERCPHCNEILETKTSESDHVINTYNMIRDKQYVYTDDYKSLVKYMRTIYKKPDVNKLIR